MTTYYTVGTTFTPGTKVRAAPVNAEFAAIQAAFEAIPTVSGSTTYGSPTVEVNLTSDGGAAASVLRSDARLALSQAIAPAWTGFHKHTHASGIEIENTAPQLTFDETDGGSNQRIWRWAASGGSLFLLTRTDVDGAGAAPITLGRTGTTVDSLALAATAITLNGVNSSDYARLSQANSFTAGPLTLSSATPFLRFSETDASVTEKTWLAGPFSGAFVIGTENDGGGGGASAVTITRTGVAVSAIALASTALTWNGNTLFTTANDGAGSGLDADLLDGVQGADYARISAANTFTDRMTLSHLNPWFRMYESDAGANEKYYSVESQAGILSWRTYDDALSGTNAFMTVDRTGITVDSIALAATTITLNGVAATDFARLSQSNTFTLEQKITTSSAALRLKDTSAGTDLKEFGWQSSSGVCNLVTYSDAGAGQSAPIQFTRNTNGTLADISFVSTALRWNGNTLFTTANDGTGSGLDADLLDGVQGANYAQIVTGSFSTSLTGMTSSTTGTINYRIVGGMCTLWAESSIIGTSNSTAMAMTSIPAACLPSGSRQVAGMAEDNARAILALFSVSPVGDLVIEPGRTDVATNFVVPGNFTASGAKGLIGGSTITYPL